MSQHYSASLYTLLIIAKVLPVNNVHCQTTSLEPQILVCPAVEDYNPCICNEFYLNGYNYFYSSLDCREKNLGDSKTSQVLNSFLLPSVTTLGGVNLTGNQLTHIPNQIAYYTDLMFIDLSFNRLDSISIDSFPTEPQYKKIYLQNNQITQIVATSEHNYYNYQYRYGSVIDLSNNLLTRLEFNPFHYVIENLYYYWEENRLIISNNLIDCSGCSMSWLLRDNRQHLPIVVGGMCSNDGTPFELTDPFAYKDCPFFCPFHPMLSESYTYPNALDPHSFYMCISNTPYFIDCGELYYSQSYQDCVLEYVPPTTRYGGTGTAPFLNPQVTSFIV